MTETNFLTLPCLDGQPFRLGMLYDARSSTVVPGASLPVPKHSITSGTLNTVESVSEWTEINTEKQFHLDVTASVKLAVLFGSISTSAKYMYDRKSSSNKVRLSMQYLWRSRIEELILSKETLEDIINKDQTGNIATHVLTGIKYGAEVSLVLERELKHSESKHDVKGPLIEHLKKIGEALDLKEKDESDGKGDSQEDALEEGRDVLGDHECYLQGDVIKDIKPKSLKDAMEFCRNISSMLDGRAVPKEVILRPLSLNANTPSQNEMKISVEVAKQSEDILREIQLAITEVKNLESHHVCMMFGGIAKQLKMMKHLLNQQYEYFREQVAGVMSCGKTTNKEAGLNKICRYYLDSPFHEGCSTWLSSKTKEVKWLENYLEFFDKQSNIKRAFKNGEMESLICNFKYDSVISFEFTSVGIDNDFLTSLSAYQKGSDGHKFTLDELFTMHFWYDSSKVSRKALQFTQFVESKKKDKKVCFVVTDRSLREASKSTKEVIVMKYCGTESEEYELSDIN